MNTHVKRFLSECSQIERVSLPLEFEFEKLSKSLSKFQDNIPSTIYVTPLSSTSSTLISFSFKFQNKFIGVTFLIDVNNYLDATLQISELISKSLYTVGHFKYIVIDELCKDLDILSEWLVK